MPHEGEMKIEQQDAHSQNEARSPWHCPQEQVCPGRQCQGMLCAALMELQQWNAFCALSFFQSVVECFHIAGTGGFWSQMLDRLKIMPRLRLPELRRIEQQPDRIAEAFQIILFKKLDPEIVFERQLSSLIQIRGNHSASPGGGLKQHAGRTCGSGIG